MSRDKNNKTPLTSMSSSSLWPHQTRSMADSQYQHLRQQHAATASACLIHLQLRVQLSQPPYQQHHRQPCCLHRRRRWLRPFHNTTIIPTSRFLLSFLSVRPLLLLHRLLHRLLHPLLPPLLNNPVPTTANCSNNPLE